MLRCARRRRWGPRGAPLRATAPLLALAATLAGIPREASAGAADEAVIAPLRTRVDNELYPLAGTRWGGIDLNRRSGFIEWQRRSAPPELWREIAHTCSTLVAIMPTAAARQELVGLHLAAAAYPWLLDPGFGDDAWADMMAAQSRLFEAWLDVYPDVLDPEGPQRSGAPGGIRQMTMAMSALRSTTPPPPSEDDPNPRERVYCIEFAEGVSVLDPTLFAWLTVQVMHTFVDRATGFDCPCVYDNAMCFWVDLFDARHDEQPWSPYVETVRERVARSWRLDRARILRCIRRGYEQIGSEMDLAGIDRGDVLALALAGSAERNRYLRWCGLPSRSGTFPANPDAFYLPSPDEIRAILAGADAETVTFPTLDAWCPGAE